MTVQERRLIPWSGDVEAPAASGGPTIPFTAGAALKIGDVVYSSAAAGVVNKSNVAANGAFFVGVVVGGGGSFGGNYSLNDSGSTGLSLVASGKIAQVQVAGIAWVVAGAAISANASVGLDTTTAGRVLGNSTSKQIIGIALDAATNAGDKIRMLIQPR